MYFRPSIYSNSMMFYKRDELGNIKDIETYSGFEFYDTIELFQWLQNVIEDFDLKFIRLEKPMSFNQTEKLFHVVYRTEQIGMIFSNNPGV